MTAAGGSENRRRPYDVRMSTPFYQKARRHLSRRDPVLKAVIKQVGPCTLTPIPHDPFTILVRCVIYQQISTKAAKSVFDRLAARVGGPPIPAAALGRLTEDDFRACGVSGPKQRALRAVIDYADANPGVLARIADLEEEAIHGHLTAIKGIGPWSVDMFLMFGISKPDVLPVGDLGIKAAMRKLYGPDDRYPTKDEMIAIAEPWRPYRTVACWYLWRSLGGVVPQSGQGG